MHETEIKTCHQWPSLFLLLFFSKLLTVNTCVESDRSANFVTTGSPGLVVVGGDSCPRGRDFESQCYIQDGSFFTFICYVKIVLTFEKMPGIANF